MACMFVIAVTTEHAATLTIYSLDLIETIKPTWPESLDMVVAK